jgi:hypothetical protein
LVLVVIGAFIVCLLTIHLTILFNSTFSARTRRRTNPRIDAFLAGLVTAALWALGLTAAFAVAAGGAAEAWPLGLAAAALPALIIGWQVAAWQEARSWVLQPGALSLGSFMASPFFVNRKYAVTPLERTKHVTVTGATGSGKSTLLRNMIVQDLRAGAGICVIDPKDDLIDGVLPHIPAGRIEDVILFDATDTERPLGINPLAGVSPEMRSLAASELISVFRRYFASAWGARLEHVLRHVILALLEIEGTTLLDVPRLLLDQSYSQWVASRVSNPAIRDFFLVEYEDVLHRRGDVKEPILNKVGPWLAYPELRNIIGRNENSFDVRAVMDQGKILFVRIPQGSIGEDSSNLLGALFVAKIQLAAQSRVNIAAPSRRPFYLYVDEFQNFATSSFTKILTEARGFSLGLVCANQYPEQLTRDLQLAVARNASTSVETHFTRGRFLALVGRLDDPDRVFEIRPPQPLGVGNPLIALQVRTRSRERFGRPVGPIFEHTNGSGSQHSPWSGPPPWGQHIEAEEVRSQAGQPQPRSAAPGFGSENGHDRADFGKQQ